ncbi:Six-hairpin glycosidase-like protein [Roridomyces roridus]|uniref:Six-hairpin glycosidase-like protein n=1 Tax=Roridomyces roridus TaxID=1738132 RepID=A0AAD7FCY5_9AGAR|nr:Six-hairpin glycosidase-like protein [Roridomyces roridus]
MRVVLAVLSLLFVGVHTTVNALQRCEDFATYSTQPQGTPSKGPLGLPYMRPDPACRTFNSSAVEKVVANLTSRMKDPDLARLFENTYTNTLDTTVKWFNENLTFVVTGDIPAEWLRDSSNQFKVYLPLVKQDQALQDLSRGVINLQAQYIGEYPYCNAFQPPPESGLPAECCSGDTGAAVSPPDNLTIVWTCGYELDSVLSFLQLSRLYYQYSQDKSIFTFNNGAWFSAVENIMQLIHDQAIPTYDAAGNVISFYNISGPNQQYMKNDGRGPPKANTGLIVYIGTTYRPSDDVVAFPYNIPHQAMAVVELRALAALLKEVGLRPDIQSEATTRASTVEAALWKWGTVLTKDWGEVFAYEVDGYGGTAMQDDPNVPSLVSIPYLGFVNATNNVYANTRKMVLSTQGNPYYGFGPMIRGVSSPHIDEKHVWPMGLITEVVTSTEDSDILVKLEYLKNTTTGLGLMHESVNTHDGSDYTRPWFAWANSYFGEAILQLAANKPHLLFTDAKPFSIADLLQEA